MLDLIEKEIRRSIFRENENDYKIGSKNLHRLLRFDGTMNHLQRSKVIRSFNLDKSSRLLLVSLKAGGVGLNLTSASVVFMVDPWWNPSIEDQAIDRVHRLGQTRPVVVYRFICADSVEERLLALQERKRNLSNKAIGTHGSDVNTYQGETSSKLSFDELKSLFISKR